MLRAGVVSAVLYIRSGNFPLLQFLLKHSHQFMFDGVTNGAAKSRTLRPFIHGERYEHMVTLLHQGIGSPGSASSKTMMRGVPTSAKVRAASAFAATIVRE